MISKFWNWFLTSLGIKKHNDGTPKNVEEVVEETQEPTEISVSLNEIKVGVKKTSKPKMKASKETTTKKRTTKKK